MEDNRISSGTFTELMQGLHWDGETPTFRFAQLSPTLLLLVGSKIPPHYLLERNVTEFWLVLPDSATVEVSYQKASETSKTWSKQIIHPGEFIKLNSEFSRSAKAVGEGEFMLLASLSRQINRIPADPHKTPADSDEIPVDPQIKIVNS